jgi:iron(III) transport system substrate-binding protein
VVVYCALDKEFSQSILDDFQQQTGVTVLAKYDQESNKTVGLANEIILQANRQRCDVFWNNEILHTLRLQKQGLLEVYHSPFAGQYPTQFVSADGLWFGFAARARVLIVNTNLLPNPTNRPTSVMDLTDPKWKDNCGIAKPLFGTTATHAAVLFAKWGDERAEKFLADVKLNAHVEGGNKQVAINVARGRYAFGLTDTDDSIIELEQGNPVAIVFPDQQADGTLLIPNTLCIVKNGPNIERARKLVDYLLDVKIEEELAKGKSAQIPLNQTATVRSRVQPRQPLKIMDVDFPAAADRWDKVSKVVARIFE